MKIKFDTQLVKLMSLFTAVTRSHLKDAIDNKGLPLIFIVQQGEIRKAVGKNGLNVKNLEHKLNRKIKILEFNPDLIRFVKNLIYPLKAKEIKQEEGEIVIEGPDTKTKGLLIGKNAKNLRNTENIVKKYFDIKEIKII